MNGYIERPATFPSLQDRSIFITGGGSGIGARLGAGVLSFALSFDETMITLLVTGTDSTLPIRLWAMMRLGFSPDINALVAIILALTTLLCILAVRLLLPDEAQPAE